MSQAARIEPREAQAVPVPAPLAAALAPVAKPAPETSFLHHARYVIGENPVTGIAFALFLIIAGCAILGPAIAPYDPLASDTGAALQPPSARHWFGTDQLGRDILSRVMAATRLDFAIAVFSVALKCRAICGDLVRLVDAPSSTRKLA